MLLKLTDLENYKGLYGIGFAGNAYQLLDDNNQEIGFILLELFKTDGLPCGTYHSFILPSKRSPHNALELIKIVFNLAFNELNLYKLFTMCNERQAKYFSWSKRMTNDNFKVLEYNVFSLTKERYLCQR